VLITSEASQLAVAGDDAEVTQGLDVISDQVALLQITSAQLPNTSAAALPRNDSVTSEAAQPADAFNDVLSDLSLRAAADDETADNVLACLLFKDHGMRVKTDRGLREGLGAIMDRRKAFVAKFAEERGVSAPRSHSEYTVEGWAEWLTNHRLDQRDMARGIKEWKEDFKERDLLRKAEVDVLEELNTRRSKKKATGIQRGALNAALAQQCGHAQLAFAFFQHPSAELDSLLEGWRSHMASEAFRRQFERSARNRDAALKKDQQELTFKVHKMRADRRQGKADHRNIEQGLLAEASLSGKRRDRLQSFRSGSLDRKVDELTRQHGYGKIRCIEGQWLLAPCFTRPPGTM